jgi:hypothetical protein
MPLLGRAAMLLSFDVDDDAVPEHDDWHTHEHLPERLSIPGFLRGTRWVATQGQPRYLVLYEVAELATLASDAYLERLDHPTPWTAKMMQRYRGMSRGLCAVMGSEGIGMGHAAVLIRFAPNPGQDARPGAWLHDRIVADLPSRRGLGSAHLLRGALAPKMTNEQRIRGADAGVEWALLVIGYDEPGLAALAHAELSAERFAENGAARASFASYRMDYTLVADEVARGAQAGSPSRPVDGPGPRPVS